MFKIDFGSVNNPIKLELKRKKLEKELTWEFGGTDTRQEKERLKKLKGEKRLRGASYPRGSRRAKRNRMMKTKSSSSSKMILTLKKRSRK